MTKYEQFKQLHYQTTPLLLGNAWNATSAKTLEKNGLQAIGTSSWAIADTFGYADGENISFDELLFIAKRIINSVSIPVSVDIEAGYSRDNDTIIANIEKIAQLGVVGINIEDSLMTEGKIELVPAKAFGEQLQYISRQLKNKGINIFINVRTDAFLVKSPAALQETLERIKIYEPSGADGIFVPFIEKNEDIQPITAATKLPVNVLSVPNLPALKDLAALGVKRVSMGSAVFRAVYRQLDQLLHDIHQQQSVQPLF